MGVNLSIIRDSIRGFIATRISIFQWDLDEPSDLTYPIGLQHYPANTAIEFPAQNLFYQRDGLNTVNTSTILPYRITYRFHADYSYHELPLRGLENVLSTVQILTLLQKPSPEISTFEPYEIEDSLAVRRSEDTSGDWLVDLNFAFRVEFKTTEFPDISDLQPPDYYDQNNPPSVNELAIRVNRAKPGFSVQDSPTYIEDSVINITNN